jgi:hypothetical protein
MTNPLIPVLTVAEQRRAAIREALTWRGTPFDFNQCVKGAGVDCGRFPAAALNAGRVEQIVIADLPKLSPQWFLHRKEGDLSLLDLIRHFAQEYSLRPNGMHELWSGPHKAVPEPADIVVARCGRDWAHCALVIQWPRVIGAAMEHVVTEWHNIFVSPQYMNRELAFFDPWGQRNV